MYWYFHLSKGPVHFFHHCQNTSATIHTNNAGINMKSTWLFWLWLTALLGGLLSYQPSSPMAQWYRSDFTAVTFRQVDIWLSPTEVLVGLLTDWLGRSASQERFYDTNCRSKSTCGPQTTISPTGLLGLPAGLYVALQISATMKVRLDGLWSSCLISQNGPTWISPTAAPTFCSPPWQLPRGSANFWRIINMWVQER